MRHRGTEQKELERETYTETEREYRVHGRGFPGRQEDLGNNESPFVIHIQSTNTLCRDYMPRLYVKHNFRH